MARRSFPREQAATAVVADPDDASRGAIVATLARLGCQVREATTGAEALEIAASEEPALFVLDVALTDGSAYEVGRTLRERFGDALAIVLVSQHRVEPADEVAGLLLGADEYLAKPFNTDVFAARIRRLLLRAGARAAERVPLTPREREVLELLVAGLRPATIATELCITSKTTSTHIEHILAKLGAHSQAQAVAFAVQSRLVAVPF